MFYVGKAGERIAVHELGGDGPTVLFAHATGFCGRMFAPIAEHLTGFRCVAVDLPGHGDSDVPSNFHWSGFAARIREVIETLDLAPCFGVGHSGGATSQLLCELSRPGTFLALYSFEPALGFGGHKDVAGPNPMSAQARRRRATFASRAALHEYLLSKALFARFDPAVLDEYETYGFRDEADGTVSLKCAPESESQTFANGATHDCFERLGEIRTRVTLVYGDQPDSFPEPMRKAMAQGLLNSELRVMKGVGHLGPFENPAKVAAELSEVFRTPM